VKRAALGAFVALALAVAGCTASRDDAADDPLGSLPSTTDADPGPPPERPTPEVPDTPAGAALTWVLDQAGSPSGPEAIAERFAESFLVTIPPEGVQSVLASVGPAGDLVEIVHDGAHELAVLVELGDDVLQVQLVVEPDPPHRLTGLVLTPAIPTPHDPRTVREVETTWPTLAERSSLLVAQVVNGECREVAAVDPDRVGPIGSAMSLYVLGAVAGAVLDGELDWEDGEPHTVRELVTRMVRDGDVDAADRLIDLVGRDAVEAAMVHLGHSSPERNRPFLTSREVWLVKLDAVGEEGLDAYLDGGEAERRALLDQWATLPLPGLERWSPTPVLVDDVGWFASPSDLCRAMVVLGELAGWPGLEPLAEILDPSARGTATWVVTGAEPGVLSVTVRLDDGDRVVVATGALVDSRTVLVPEGGVVGWVRAAARLALG
jgi:hypothetical protein